MRVGACPSLPTDDPTCPTQEYCPSVLPAACPNSLRRLVTLPLGRRSLLEHGGRRPRSRGGAAPAAATPEVPPDSVRAVGSQGGVRAAVLGREMVDSLAAVWAPGPAPTVARAAPPASAVWGADGQSLGRSLSVSGRPLQASRGGFEGAEATAQDEGERPGPWLWQGWPCGAAAGEGGRRVNRLEGTGGRGGSDGDGGA